MVGYRVARVRQRASLPPLGYVLRSPRPEIWILPEIEPVGSSLVIQGVLEAQSSSWRRLVPSASAAKVRIWAILLREK